MREIKSGRTDPASGESVFGFGIGTPESLWRPQLSF